MTPTIYVLGHLDVFQQALVGLQMIFHPTTGSTDWAASTGLFGAGPIVVLGLLASLLHLSTKGIWTQQLHVHHVPLMLVLYAAFFIPVTNVDVHDILSGQDAIVDNIPIGVVYPAAIISNLGYDAATQLGQAFQSPTSTTPPTDISQGVASPLRQMMAIRRMYGIATSQEPALSQDIADYVGQCIYPNAPNQPAVSWPTIYTAQSLATVLFASTATLSGNIQMMPLPSTLLPSASTSACSSTNASGTYCTETCAQAESDLQSAMTTWMGAGSGGCGAAITAATASTNSSQVTNCSTSVNTNLGPVVAASPTASALLTSSNNFGVNYVENMYLSCLATQGWQMGLNAAAASENSELTMPSYCVIEGSAQNLYNVNSAASGNMFLENMAGMMSVLQFLFFALSPLVAAAMVFAGAQGLGLLMKFILFGMWTQSWMAVAAILNDYAQYNVSDALAQIMAPTVATGSTTTSAVGLTSMANLGLLIDHVQKTLASADTMLAMTPIITMFVFTGSYMALANVASRMSGDVKDPAGVEAQSVGEQEKSYGIQAGNNPMAPGYFAASANASTESVGVSATANSATNWATQVGAQSTHAYTEQWARAISSGGGLTVTNGRGQRENLVDGIAATISHNDAYGQLYNAGLGANMSNAHAMAFATAVTLAGATAAQQFKALHPNATEAQIGEVAANAAQKEARSLLGGLLKGAASGFQANIMPTIRDDMTSQKTRNHMYNVASGVQGAFTRSANATFTNDSSSGQISQFQQAIHQAQTDQASATEQFSQAAAIARQAQESASFGGKLEINAVSAFQAIRSRPDALQVSQAILNQAYGNNAVAAQHALETIGQAGEGRSNPIVARLRAAIAAIKGNMPGVSDADRFEAGNMLFSMYDGTSLRSIGSGMAATQNSTGNLYKNIAGQTGSDSNGLVPKVQAAAKAAAPAARAAELRAGTVVHPNYGEGSGTTPQAMQGEINGLFGQGMAIINANSKGLPTDQAIENTLATTLDHLNDPVLNGPVQAMWKDPRVAAGAGIAINVILGMGGAYFAGRQLKKLANAKSKQSPGAQDDSVGGGDGNPGASDVGANASPAAPADAPITFYDQNGNPIARTTAADVSQAAEEIAGKSGGTVGDFVRALGERAAALGTDTVEIGSKFFRFAGGTVTEIAGPALDVLGPVAAVAQALTPTDTASGYAPLSPQQQQMVAAFQKADDYLMATNQPYRDINTYIRGELNDNKSLNDPGLAQAVKLRNKLAAAQMLRDGYKPSLADLNSEINPDGSPRRIDQ